MSLVRLRPVWMTNHPPSVLWHCWLGHQTCKNRRPYNLYCVGADVKPCSINQSVHQQVPCTRKKMIFLGSRLIACCKLAPTLARQMWRHNYVIDRKEYLIFTLSESTNSWVYSLQFLFKSTNNSWRYERKCERVFFSEHSVICCCLSYRSCQNFTPISEREKHYYRLIFANSRMTVSCNKTKRLCIVVRFCSSLISSNMTSLTKIDGANIIRRR